jgi:hypothetical protein
LILGLAISIPMIIAGAALESASSEAKRPCTPFVKLFERLENKDEEATERADILTALHAIFSPPRTFTSADLFAHFEEWAKRAYDGETEDISTTELRRFCTPKRAKNVSAKSIGRALGSIVEAPVSVAAGILVLKSNDARLDRDKTRHFHLRLIKTAS